MLEKNILHIDGGFEFEAGGFLPSVDIVYHASPGKYEKGRKVVWICHAFTANSNPEDWWPEMVGEGKTFDPSVYYVVCANMLCSPYGSTGPASLNPATGKPYLNTFPKTTGRDIVRTFIILRKALGIDRVDFIIGASVGGFHAVEWAVMEPDVIARSVFLATSPRVTPYHTAMNEAQRMALRADESFIPEPDASRDADICDGKTGLACARAIGMLTYRCDKCFTLDQSEKDSDTLFADRSASYQRYQGLKLANRFDAYSYWYLLLSADSHNVGRGRGGVSRALSKVNARCTVISIDTDIIFTPYICREFASMLPYARYMGITSDYGHDGFLKENGKIREIISPILENLE